MIGHRKSGQAFKQHLALAGTLLVLALFTVSCGGVNDLARSSSRRTVYLKESINPVISVSQNVIPGVRYHFIVKSRGRAAHEFLILPVATSRLNSTTYDMDIHTTRAGVVEHTSSQARPLDLLLSPVALMYRAHTSLAGKWPRLLWQL